MTDYVIIGLLALIWISNTRYSTKIANNIENVLAGIRHKVMKLFKP